MFKTTEDIFNEIQEVKRLLESLLSNNQNEEKIRETKDNIRNGDAILEQLYEEINICRASNKVRPLIINKFLEKAADTHAHDMFINSFMGHASSNGMTYEQRSKTIAPQIFPMGEVLMKGPGGPNAIKTIMAAWMENPSIRANIIDPNSRYMGAGYRLKTEEIKGNYWCAVFGN